MSASASHLSGTSEGRFRSDGMPKGKQFAKGKSGNPGGRYRKGTLEELCRAHTPEAVHALVLALQSPRERVPAAIALLDRGWGKPVQMISGDPNRPVAIDFRWADSSPVAPQIEGAATDVDTHTNADTSVSTQLADALIQASDENKE